MLATLRAVDVLASFAGYLGGPPPLGGLTVPRAAGRADAAPPGAALHLRFESLPVEFFDIGAVVYFLRKVIWMVPGFTVDRYRDRLRELDEQIRREGPFVAHSTRFLIEARKPA